MWPFKPNVQKMQESGNVRGLMKALSHKSEDVSSAAAEALRKIGPPGDEVYRRVTL